MRFLEKFRKGWRLLGFTVAGFAVFIISITMLIRSLHTRNAYEIFVSGLMLFIFTVLYITGRWGSRRLAVMEPQWKAPYPMTANAGKTTLVSGLSFSLPWFFRLHAAVKGHFFPSGGQKGCLMSAQTAVPFRNNSTEVDFCFPMSGVFNGEGFTFLRDIFGLFSFQSGSIQKQTLNVMSSPDEGRPFMAEPSSGAEDRRNKSANDEERYYMREYTPGDRFRDINWKSSERIDTLITRISPDTNEKVCRLEVYFRNFGPAEPSIADFWLLDRAKARLANFLRTLKESEKAYIFTVHTAMDSRDIDDKESLEEFLQELAALTFFPAMNEYPSAESNELYVFSTACDKSLPAFLLTYQTKKVLLFMVQGADRIKNKEVQLFFMRNFFKKNCIPRLGWLFKRKPQCLNLDATRLDITYADTRL